MTTDTSLLASSLIGDGLNPSPYKEAKAKAERYAQHIDKLHTLLREIAKSDIPSYRWHVLIHELELKYAQLIREKP